jgi:exo-beta-1,3-glucanase (GH17 family)
VTTIVVNLTRENPGGKCKSTSNVESDFSILKWTKDDHNTALTDFSLGSKIHARQLLELQEFLEVCGIKIS